MKTPLEQLEAIERMRSILSLRQFAAFVGIDTPTATGDTFDRYLDLTPDQVEAEFGTSRVFRTFIRAQLEAQREAAARQAFAPVPVAVSEPEPEPEPEPTMAQNPTVAPEPLDDDSITELDELEPDVDARLAEICEAVEAATGAEDEAAVLEDEAMFDGLHVEPIRPIGA